MFSGWGAVTWMLVLCLPSFIFGEGGCKALLLGIKPRALHMLNPITLAVDTDGKQPGLGPVQLMPALWS